MQINIDSQIYNVDEGKTILEVCIKNNIYVPYLCYHPDIEHNAKCRMCIVEVNNKIETSCNTIIKKIWL